MTYEIKFLRGGPCGDGVKCPAIAEVAGKEDLYVIYPSLLRDLLDGITDETDPAILTAFADSMSPDERLGRVVRSRLPEVGNG